MVADVIIAGAGPNGLLLAIELSLAGVRPIVLERRPQRSDEPRANGLVGQVIRMLDRRGLYEQLAGTPTPAASIPYFAFGALPLDLGSLERNPLDLLPVPQQRIEEVLQERALALGVQIRRGHALTDLRQDAETVQADVLGPDGSYRLSAHYLVGADGGRSLVRKTIGVGFPGVTNDAMVSRTAHVALPDGLIDPVSGNLEVPGYGAIRPFLHHRTERGLFVFAPFPGQPVTVSTGDWTPPGEAPMTRDELQASVRRVLGVDLALLPPEGPGPHQLRRVVGGNSRLADHYRTGRVLLVGDAAHVHSAIGGPGLNLGLQDAMNLGWKLAGQIHGWAPDDLLDSYESERRPVGQRVVMQTQAQSALIAPGSAVTALRELFGELLQDAANVQRLADLMSGADIAYAPGDHPLTGRWAPDLVITGEPAIRLAELTRSARPLLLDLTGHGLLGTELPTDRFDVVRGRSETPGAPAAMLIRPDGYVAWASDNTDPAEADGLLDAAVRWFGCAELSTSAQG